MDNSRYKFRGKRIDNGEWVYGYLVMSEASENYYIITEFYESQYKSDYETCFSYQVIPETVGQYTGFPDKKGKEIYEDDIVKSTDVDGGINKLDSDTGFGKIEWLDEYGFWNISGIENSLGDIILISECDVEVIGNKFENSKLKYKSMEYYINLDWNITIRHMDGDSEPWTARVDELPGCMSHGKTQDESESKIKDAIKSYILVAMERGEEISEPKNGSSK